MKKGSRVFKDAERSGSFPEREKRRKREKGEGGGGGGPVSASL